MDDPEPTSLLLTIPQTNSLEIFLIIGVFILLFLILLFTKYAAVFLPKAHQQLPKNIIAKLCVVLLLSSLNSCEKDDYIPKPEGQVRLEYPTPKYLSFSTPNCPFEFEYSNFTKIINRDENCWYNINYPKMRSTLYITYSPVQNNIYNLIKEAQKLVNEHKIKANSVKIKSFIYPEKKVYGSIYRLGGESASNIQFYVTDSTKHFLSGNVYFKVQPKPDSLQPAIEYIERDVIKLIETTTWK